MPQKRLCLASAASFLFRAEAVCSCKRDGEGAPRFFSSPLCLAPAHTYFVCLHVSGWGLGLEAWWPCGCGFLHAVLTYCAGGWSLFLSPVQDFDTFFSFCFVVIVVRGAECTCQGVTACHTFFSDSACFGDLRHMLPACFWLLWDLNHVVSRVGASFPNRQARQPTPALLLHLLFYFGSVIFFLFLSVGCIHSI